MTRESQGPLETSRDQDVPPIQWFWEEPFNGARVSNGFLIRGWFWAADPAIRLRVRVGKKTWSIKLDQLRPDVALTHPQVKPGDPVGFQMPLILPHGSHQLQLEWSPQLPLWHTLDSRQVQVQSAPLQVALDQVAYQGRVDAPVEIAGWCFHPYFRIKRLKISALGVENACWHGLLRDDVAAAFPESLHARASGFRATVSLPPGTHTLSLLAELEGEDSLTWPFPTAFEIADRPIRLRVSNALHQARELVSFGFSRLERRIRHRGWAQVLGESPHLMRRGWRAFRHQQSLRNAGAIPFQGCGEPEDPYECWVKLNGWTPAREAHLQARLAGASDLPRISVVMPVYNPPLDLLERAIESVIQQVYPNWELCLADDASTDPQVLPLLRSWVKRDPRIKLLERRENGNISLATNSAASLAQGAFLALLDNDDELTPDALGEVALALAGDPQIDLLYSDDDKMDLQGRRYDPQFKPDFSPELLLSYMYMGHLLVLRRELYQELGGMRTGFEGAQDYDMALRASEKARKVAHLPLMLYHWRAIPGSTAISGKAKPKSLEAGRLAVQEALTRRGSAALACQPQWAQEGGVGIYCHQFPDTGPEVTLLIPLKDKVELLENLLASLSQTTYRNYKVLILDNQSQEKATRDFLARQPWPVLSVSNPPGGFNYAAVHNQAVKQVSSPYLLFLNNDITVESPVWLSQLMGYAQMPGVGAVGARLLYPDRRIQHAGILHGLHDGLAGHAFKLLDASEMGYLSMAGVTRNYLAVTAACMVTRRELFVELGGFDQEHLAVAYNDVDYGYRLHQRGFRSVYAPQAELIHYEGASRGFLDRPAEAATFRRRYNQLVDPFYSPHLSLEHEHFAIRPRRLGSPLATPIGVLCVGNQMTLTGAPFHQVELALGLHEAGRIVPTFFSPEDGPLAVHLRSKGYQATTTGHPLEAVLSGSETYEAAVSRLAETFRRAGHQLVYANTLEAFYAVDAAAEAGIASIWNVHESDDWRTYFLRYGPQIARRAWECFTKPYRVIFVSHATRKLYEPLNTRHNFAVIHNGLDTRRLASSTAMQDRSRLRQELGVEEKELLFLTLGTVCERKGQLDLPGAIALLPESYQRRMVCCIVGDRDSEYSQYLHEMVEGLPKGCRVKILAERPDVAAFYQAADVFVCTSRVESFPRVIQEALYFGLPVLTTPVFGIPEQVQAEINGLFYEPGKLDELAAGLRRFIDEPAWRAHLGTQSRDVFRRLNSLQDMVESYGQLMQEAVS